MLYQVVYRYKHFYVHLVILILEQSTSRILTHHKIEGQVTAMVQFDDGVMTQHMHQ